jgi:hypothetical protein
MKQEMSNDTYPLLSSPRLTLLAILLKKLAINGYMEVFNYGKKKNNDDFFINSFQDKERKPF